MSPGIVPGEAFQAYPIEKRLQEIPERSCLSPEELEVLDLCLDCSHHESGSDNQQRMNRWTLPNQQTANIHVQLHRSLWREEENLISQSPISSIKWCCFFLPMELAKSPKSFSSWTGRISSTVRVSHVNSAYLNCRLHVDQTRPEQVETRASQVSFRSVHFIYQYLFKVLWTSRDHFPCQ